MGKKGYTPIKLLIVIAITSIAVVVIAVVVIAVVRGDPDAASRRSARDVTIGELLHGVPIQPNVRASSGNESRRAR